MGPMIHEQLLYSFHVFYLGDHWGRDFTFDEFREFKSGSIKLLHKTVFCVDDDDDQFIYINRYLRQLMWIKLSDWNPLLLISKICKERRIENLISKLNH